MTRLAQSPVNKGVHGSTESFLELRGPLSLDPLSVWLILRHIGIQATVHYTMMMTFVLLSSIWGQINLVSGMRSIVAIPQRARESGKHSDFGGTCWTAAVLLGLLPDPYFVVCESSSKALIALQMLSVVFTQLLPNTNLPGIILKAHLQNHLPYLPPSR